MWCPEMAEWMYQSTKGIFFYMWSLNGLIIVYRGHIHKLNIYNNEKQINLSLLIPEALFSMILSSMTPISKYFEPNSM